MRHHQLDDCPPQTVGQLLQVESCDIGTVLCQFISPEGKLVVVELVVALENKLENNTASPPAIPLLAPRGLRTPGWERLLYNTAKQGQLGTVQPTNQVHCFRNGPSAATKYLKDLINQKKQQQEASPSPTGCSF